MVQTSSYLRPAVEGWRAAVSKSNLSGYAGSLSEKSWCARAAQVLKLHFAVPTAIMFLRRYYSVKAVQENDRFIVVCACVFLAAKCEEEPRNLNDVCYQIFKFRYAVWAPADSCSLL